MKIAIAWFSFTLIALAAFVGLVSSNGVSNCCRRTKASCAQGQIRSWAGIVVQYFVVHGHPPASLEELTRDDPLNEGCPYAERLPTDPWGHALAYGPRAGGGYEITCFGADGVAGGTGDDADITMRVSK